MFKDNVDLLKTLLTAKPRLNLRAHGETPISLRFVDQAA